MIGHAAMGTHLEQLHRLGLEALGRIHEHDRGVHGGEHAVRVLGEVGVARGVEEVEDGSRGTRTAERPR
jgi:hypothetical protein